MDIAGAEKIFKRLQNGNDVRGAAVGTEKEEKTLTPSLAAIICESFLAFLSEKTGKAVEELRVGAGHDSRITADAMMAGILRGLGAAQAYDCGLISTPAMFQSTILPGSDFDGAVMVTASHLPWNRSGLKFFTKDGALEKSELSTILQRAAARALELGCAEDEEQILTVGALPQAAHPAQAFDLKSLYCAAMAGIIKESVQAQDYDHPLKGLHIIVDAGNGAAGFFASDILGALGADTTGSVFLDPDGTFPNHVPNPEDKKAIEACRQATVQSGADLGVIFDCDGDRGAVVLSDGTEVNRNTLIAMLSAIVAKTAPGSTIVTDSCTSDELAEFLAAKGLVHLRYRRGYKNVIDKGIELNAAGQDCELAIETSGHGAFKENHFSDDGAYIAVKIICEMASLRREGKSLESLIEGLGQPAEAAEVRFHIDEEDFHAYGQEVLDQFLAFAKADPRMHVVEPSYEGVRVSFDDEQVRGWVLLRLSLHDPVLPMNLESREAGGVQVLLDRVLPFFADKRVTKM